MQLKFAVPMAEVSDIVLGLRDVGIEADISAQAHDDTGVITVATEPEAAERVREAVRSLASVSEDVSIPLDQDRADQA